jgi:hypothetical protein
VGTVTEPRHQQLDAGLASSAPLTYKFELYNAAGANLHVSPPSARVVAARRRIPFNNLTLEGDATCTPGRRAPSFPGTFTAWTPRVNATFVAPSNEGISRATRCDPLINGKTVGEIHGPVQFIPGVGIKLLGQTSYQLRMQSTLFEGEFSLLVTNLATNTKGGRDQAVCDGQGLQRHRRERIPDDG